MENRTREKFFGKRSGRVVGPDWVIVSLLLLVAVLLLFVGCAPAEKLSGESAYRTLRKTAFFRYGPAQSAGAETLGESLPVTVTALDGGYARVRLEDSRSGYVDRADLALLPTPPAAPREEIVEVPLPEDPAPDCTQVPEEMLFASMPHSSRQDDNNEKALK